MESTPAVAFRGACKAYGRKGKPALDGLDMRVPSGAIYALLGASGCGKTTAISCSVGRLKLDGGRVEVFGFPPGSAAAGVPGRRVGYMPQELALHLEVRRESRWP